MTKPEWTDATSYSRDDTDRKPTCHRITVGDLRISVTCGHIYHSPNWVMHCGALAIDTKRLQAKTLEEAQAEAIAVVKTTLAKLTAAYYQIEGRKPIK